MRQYFTNRRYAKTEKFNGKQHVHVDNKIFANEKLDEKGNIYNCSINNCTFSEIGFKESKIHQSDFSFCVFIDCYFKNTELKQIDFTGCKFINCTFNGNKLNIENCDFRYATFERCFIPFDIMKLNLPVEEENLRASLCNNLSIQCLSLGDYENYKAYLFEERHAGEIHEFRKLFHKTGSYYDKKYNFLEGVVGLFNFIRSKISKHLWGYGEKISTLIRNIVLIILLFGVTYFLIKNNIIYEKTG